jgi:hypothetical protein
VDETYRMLGREHEADLEREAQKRALAAAARAARPAPRPALAEPRRREWFGVVASRLTTFLQRRGLRAGGARLLDPGCRPMRRGSFSGSSTVTSELQRLPMEN